ncbi:MAG: phosphatidylserine/phosphatidylglycerophosphate/cardiolipin synthase family protein [Candidatus Dormibacteraeota bacterium]|nr:phosphatidylserine/phosphatidylglycerophosphate/cardiolipin synthase family protein [Candidatus Dormibacteraeota bacterium]
MQVPDTRVKWGCLLLMSLAGCGGTPQPSRVAPVPPPPVTAGATMGRDEVQVYTNGAAATAELLRGVNEARRSIDAEIYEFGRPDLVEAMLRALRRGVEVRVLGDPTVDVTVATTRRLAAAGAIATFFPVGPRQIDHVKLMVIDGRVALFGGVNWGARSYRNQDYELRIVGPAVARLERVFAVDLGRAGGAIPAGTSSPAQVQGPEPVLLTSFPDDQIGRAVVSALRAARRSIHVEMFVMTDAATISALTDAARRGLDVRVLFDPGQDLNQPAMVTLRAAGARCRFYRSGGEKLHAKVAVVDGDQLLVGSANWTASGFRHNHELDAELVEPVLAAAVDARMDADWLAAA